ncbi:MAG: pyrroline-5-carboxylate reductase [Planctomycetaceae bacterium]|nr:pyrroline-5-carboxylate reductase [Planctomycetaceae bacterium]
MSSPASHLPHRIGFLGSGQMAAALGGGFVAAGAIPADHLVGYDVNPNASKRFQSAIPGAILATSPAELCQKTDVVFLSVKPQHMTDALSALTQHLTDQHLIVSIAAGIPLATLTSKLGAGRRYIRVMPNTPALVSAGASAFCRGGKADDRDAAVVAQLLGTVGRAEEVPEKLMDAVTGLSGSGPAYGFLMIEALADGGVRAGLPRALALMLAAQTVLGAAKMVLETGQHPGALKDAVASPGGTTIAGLHALEQGGVRGILMDAVVAATERARELGG